MQKSYAKPFFSQKQRHAGIIVYAVYIGRISVRLKSGLNDFLPAAVYDERHFGQLRHAEILRCYIFKVFFMPERRDALF